MQKRPNFVVFITDQQRRDTIGAYGSPICRTPNIDWIAANGMRFDRAYTPTGLCSPVRSSLMSGVYPPHTPRSRQRFAASDQPQPELEGRQAGERVEEGGLPTGLCRQMACQRDRVAARLRLRGLPLARRLHDVAQGALGFRRRIPTGPIARNPARRIPPASKRRARPGSVIARST